ncbi:hypothetical protein [Desulfosarcina ovata]|uniref:hypothetical protein n=1 Tax=Desulfosarcina ovata TaxID=83564 RepID=UPI0012D371F0|nr:hypothetical protein [Desulfosarcina ovata]
MSDAEKAWLPGVFTHSTITITPRILILPLHQNQRGSPLFTIPILNGSHFKNVFQIVLVQPVLSIIPHRAKRSSALNQHRHLLGGLSFQWLAGRRIKLYTLANEKNTRKEFFYKKFEAKRKNKIVVEQKEFANIKIPVNQRK